MFAHSTHKKVRPVVRTTAMLAGLLGAWLVQAQDMNERLRACDKLTDTNEKLACFDAVVKSLDDSSTEPVVTSAADSAVAAPTPDSAAAVPASPAAASAAKDAVDTATPAAAPAAAAATVPAAEIVTETATQEDNFGLSQQQIAAQQQATMPEPEEEAEEEAEPRSIQATIVEAWSTIDGRFEARLDNGQVWRETERTRWSNRPPKVGTSVVIKKGWLGGYRMKIGDNNRLAAVRRSDR